METTGRRSVLVRITKNPFFNFKESVKQRLRNDNVKKSAATISVIAGREWRSMNADAKKPFRKLASLAQSKGRSYFISLEYLNTYVRYPDSIQFDENVMKLAPILNKLRVSINANGSASSNEMSPKPDKKFGGYEVPAQI